MFNNSNINVISNYHFNFGVNETPSLPYSIITFPYHMVETPITYTWSKLKSLFQTRSQLSHDITTLANTMQQDHALSDIEKKSVNEALNSVDYAHMKNDLAQIFRKASKESVTDIIKQGVEQGLQQNKQELNLRPFDLIDNERLMELCQTNPDKLAAEIDVHAELVKDNLRNPLADVVVARYRRIIPTIVHYIHRIIEVFISAFGLESLDKALENGYSIGWIFEIIQEIILMPIVLCGMMTPFIGFLPALGVTSAVVGSFLLAMFIYTEFFRPCPERIDHGDNMTLLAKRGEYEPVVAREQEIEDLIKALSSHQRAIIVGKTGVGKTELVKLLAQRIASGKVPEFLKDKTLFQLNTAEFADVTGIEKLRTLQSKLLNFENKVILFFDEVHVACKPENKNLGDFLKTFSQRYMTIAATTDEEYQHVSTDGAFSGRFCKLEVNPSNDEQTATIVFEYFRRLLPNIEISLEQVKLIVELTNKLKIGRNQPDRAKNAVYGIVARLQNNIPLSLNEEKAQLLRKEGLLKKQFSLGTNDIVNDSIVKDLTSIKEKIKNVDDKMTAQMEKVKAINHLQALRRQIRFDNHEMAVELSEGHIPQRQVGEMKAKWLLENRFVLPILNNIINKKADEIPETTTRITDKLIQEVVDAMSTTSKTPTETI